MHVFSVITFNSLILPYFVDIISTETKYLTEKRKNTVTEAQIVIAHQLPSESVNEIWVMGNTMHHGKVKLLNFFQKNRIRAAIEL